MDGCPLRPGRCAHGNVSVCAIFSAQAEIIVQFRMWNIELRVFRRRWRRRLRGRLRRRMWRLRRIMRFWLWSAARAGITARFNKNCGARPPSAAVKNLEVEKTVSTPKLPQDRVGLGWRPELAAGIFANFDKIDVVEV